MFGNTIIEVLVAMSIMTCCSALAVVIYLNIQKSSLSFFKIKATEIAETYLRETIRSGDFSEGTARVEEFTLKRTVYPAERFPDCLVTRIIVFDVNKKKVLELESVNYRGN